MEKRWLVLGILLLIWGCSNDAKGGEIFKDFRVGTEGLVMNFMPNAPPPSIFSTDKLVLGLEVKNRGAYTIKGGKIYLSGFDTNLIKEFKSDKSDGASVEGIFSKNVLTLPELPGKSQFNPDGGYNVFTATSEVNIPEGINTYSPTIYATACFEYATEASADICIDPDAFSMQTRPKACTTSGVTLSGGQGAPIQVTYISVKPSGKNTVRLTFTINNAKEATSDLVFDAGSLKGCDPSDKDGIPIEKRNVVKVASITVGSDSINIGENCQPKDGLLKLYEGRAIIDCTYNFGDKVNAAYETPVTIKLVYGYRTSIARTVTITRVPSTK